MFSRPDLRELIDIRLRDVKVLLDRRRYSAAIYFAGFAVEIALKYKISIMYYFRKGFPETRAEFQTYYDSGKKKALRQTIRTVQEIRNQNLTKLLFYSGEQYKIQTMFASEWSLISGWSPEMRYKIRPIRKSEAQARLAAISAIIEGVFRTFSN